MSNKEHAKELIINTLVFGMGTFVSKIIVFILLPVYTTYLTASELGEGELVVNLMNFLFPLASVNILSALLRFSMDSACNLSEVLVNAILTIIVGIIIIGGIFSFIEFDSVIFNWKGYLILLLISYSISQILSVFSKAIDKTKVCAIGSIIYSLFLLVFNLFFLICLHRGTAGYLESIILSGLAVSVYYYYKLRIWNYFKDVTVNRKLFKEMLLFSAPLIVNSLSWWLMSFCDRFFLERYVGSEAVGLYSVSSKFPTIISTIGAVFMQAWVLSAIKVYENHEDTSFYARIFQKYWVAFILLAAIFIFVLRPIMPFLARGGFEDSWTYVPYLMCAAVFSGIAGFYSSLYTCAKRNTSVAITTIAGAVVNLLLNILFIPMIGIMGAVVATMASQLFVALYRMFDLRRFVQFRVQYVKLSFSVIFLLAEGTILVSNVGVVYVFVCLIAILVVNISEERILYQQFVAYCAKGISRIKKMTYSKK